jgi:hypothetical protein
MIDVDGSPSGYIAWYNHYTGTSRIRMIRPAVKNDKFGVQRMEMLAIYFALVDNRLHFRRVSKRLEKKRQQQLIMDVRSDSKSTVEQLQGMSEIRDTMLRRICRAITKLLVGMTYYTILFNHLERTRNIAGLLLEQRRRKQKEQFILLDRINNMARYRRGRLGGFPRFRPLSVLLDNNMMMQFY